MATANPNGGDVTGSYGDLPGLGVDDHVGLAVDDGGYSSNHSSGAGSEDEDLEEAALSMEDRVKMAEIWVANPSSSHHWTSGAGGGMILNDDVWKLRIHFDSQPNINMKLCSSDVTFLNLYVVLQTQGFYLSDELYHMRNLGIGEEREQGLDLIDTNIKLQELKKELNHSLVLNLLVRSTTTYLAASAGTEEDKLAAIVYEPPVLYDLSEPTVLVVDPEGVVFHSNPSQPTAFCTQESINFRKDNLNAIIEEEPVFEQSHNSSDDAYDSDNNSDNSSQLGEEEEDVDKSEDSDENSDEEILHYEGDTDVEDLFEQEDEDVFATEEPQMQKSPERRKKLEVRRKGPTTRSHCSVLEDVIPDFIPSEDEEDDCLLFEDDDDGHEPPSFVLPKGRKSRAKKRKPRIWYNDKLEHPHQQLFIKGEKAFAIKKMRLEHTFPTNTEKSRISAKWLAKTYESLFRSDPSTSINTLMDNCRENYGVDVRRHMAYRAKNLVVEVVLGEHKKQYPRLRDYAHTIMDTNPGSRVVVTTVTSKPTTKIPHPAPRFHAMFFCINGAREGFLNGCRPSIGVDGCFIKLTTGAEILAATRRDGNNNIFPLAFAIVGQEDTANWCWFLHQLKICLGGEIGKFGPYTIMSDRQKGLLNAVNQVFPNCHQRFFLRHLYANFQNAGEHDWTRTSGPDIEPPTFHVKRGRKKEKRIKGKFEARSGQPAHATTRAEPAPARPRKEARSQPPRARSTRRSRTSGSVNRPFTTPRFVVGASSSYAPAPRFAARGSSSSALATRFAAGASSSSPGGSSAAPTPRNHSGWMAFFTASGNHD
ncbi:wd repeat-containing protein 43 [Hordeum vulgare]|nr:wd repeat-containing protein 43 [Hordeum vulgare]